MTNELNLPEGWEIKKLGELYNITSSKRVYKSEWRRSGVPFYRAREIVKLAQQGFVENELFITEEMYDQYSVKYDIPKEGDIMVTGVGTLGICYVVQNSDKFYFKDGNIIWLKKKNGINSQFVEYAFKSDFLRKQIDNTLGATVGTYTIIKAKNTLIPTPSLPEQKRIVAILDEAFENIARAKESAEKNLKNANEIFESYLQNVFENKGEGWEEKTLGDVCELKHGFAFAGNDFNTDYGDDKPIVLTPGNFHESANLYFTQKNTKRYNGKILNEWIFNKGDLVVVMTDLSSQMKILGKPAFIEYENILHNQRIGRFIFKNEGINKRFIYYYLQTQAYLTQIKETATGTMVKHTAPKRILKNNIFIPSIHNQNIIVAKLDTLSAETKKLEAIYTQKLADLEELKKSILQKAFNGELTEASA